MSTHFRPRREIEVEEPRTLFVDRSSQPLAIDWPTLYPGGFEVPLTASGQTYLDVRAYRKVSVLVGATKAHNVILHMGKWTPNTLATSYQWTPDDAVHTFDVVGPQIALFMTSPFDRTTPTEKVELWLYLTA
jgi:hypothetical protein